jgi:riboflavin synthase
VFTGIVQERGRVSSFEDGRLVVESGVRAAVGDSVAVDGVCLTVVEAPDGRLAFDVVQETLDRTKPFGDEVNLEGALRAGEPLGGHYVQGHVDGVCRVRSREADGVGARVSFETPPELLRYVVEKGSVAVQGVALTVTHVDDETFGVALIPYTLEHTTLGAAAEGDELNLEVDVLGKYVERLIASRIASSR